MSVKPSGVLAVTTLVLLAVGGPAAMPASSAPVSFTRAAASPATLAAARAATAALPHSPQLLSELASHAGLAGVADRAAIAGRAAGTMVRGIDVAAFQHPHGARIRWALVAAAGYTFAAVKATEGDYYVNPWAASDLAAAKAAGLYVTAYHFAVPNVSGGAAQARYAVGHAGYRTGGHMLPLMLDIEYDPYVAFDHTNECYGFSHATMRAWIAAFVSTVRVLTGQFPVIYTTAGWWDRCTGWSRAFTADALWVAAYGVASPPMPAGWATWTFWQYTSSGTVRGVDSAGSTDLSDFNASVVGLIDPGKQRSRASVTVSLHVNALDTVARRPLRYKASGLPRGLAINASGTITGRVRGAAKMYQVTVHARNSAGSVGSVRFTWQVTRS